MKKIMAILLLTAAFLSANESGNIQVNDLPETLEVSSVSNTDFVFRTIGIRETYYLPISKENGYTINISYTYPADYKDKAILSKLQQHFLEKNLKETATGVTMEEALKKFYETKIKEYREDNESTSEDETWALAWELHSTGEILFCNESILQYAVNQWQFSGGAHGIGGASYYLLNLKTGEEFKASDIFMPDSKEAVRDLIIPSLLEYWGAKSLDDVVDKEWKEELMENIWKQGTNFGVTTKGILFSYSDYELGYYALGQPEALVSYQKILPYLRKDSPVYPIAEAAVKNKSP